MLNRSVSCKIFLCCEFLAAFSVPCLILALGTAALPMGIMSLASGEINGLVIIGMILGGYLGMLGVLSQLIYLVSATQKHLKLTSFIYTFVGCVAVAPFTYVMFESGDMLDLEDYLMALMGIAPILVAIQLTFMNRQKLFEGLAKAVKS